MEFMGFKECMNFLLGYGIVITSFISDRHVSIASHMRKVLTGITHYFDIWHLKKKIRKVLSKISKEKGCEALSEWIKPCEITYIGVPHQHSVAMAWLFMPNSNHS